MRHHLVALLLFVTAMLAPGSALGRQPAGTPAPALSAESGERRGDLDFPGGTVKQYVDAVAKSFGSANAGVFPGVESIAVSPVQLRQVTLEESMHLLHALSGGGVVIQNFRDVYAVIPHSDRPRALEKQIRVWPLAEVLAQIRPDDALSAVKAALDLAGDGAEVKFHADTSLLIISGSERQIDAADQVVDRLRGVASWHRFEAEQAARPVEKDAGSAVAALQQQAESLRAERDRLAERVHALELELSPRTPPGVKP